MPGVTRSFFPLFAPCAKSVSQLLCNHAFPRSFTKTPGWGAVSFPNVQTLGCSGIPTNSCNRMWLCGKLCGLKGGMDEDEEANSVRGCNASHVAPIGNDRECLARSERRTKWSAQRLARHGAFDSDSRGHADRRGERSAAKEPAHFSARGAHCKSDGRFGGDSRRG